MKQINLKETGRFRPLSNTGSILRNGQIYLFHKSEAVLVNKPMIAEQIFFKIDLKGI